MARVFTSHSVMPPSVQAELAALIAAGGLVAVPTESSYALCTSPYNREGVERLYRVKGRAETKPILVLIGRHDQLAPLVATIPAAATLLMTHCWPGPVTMVLPASEVLPVSLTAGSRTIGVRLPNWLPLTRLLSGLGPLTGTSANRSGCPALMTADEVSAALGSELDAVVDLGPAGGAAPSTVIAFDQDSVRVLREGPLTAGSLQEILDRAGYRLARG